VKKGGGERIYAGEEALQSGVGLPGTLEDHRLTIFLDNHFLSLYFVILLLFPANILEILKYLK
jgi:hypothetical protein